MDFMDFHSKSVQDGQEIHFWPLQRHAGLRQMCLEGESSRLGPTPDHLRALCIIFFISSGRVEEYPMIIGEGVGVDQRGGGCPLIYCDTPSDTHIIKFFLILHRNYIIGRTHNLRQISNIFLIIQDSLERFNPRHLYINPPIKPPTPSVKTSQPDACLPITNNW